ncbi:hypothetical protein ACIA5E_18430 [Nocardia asteroides]|uniref:hypothetical protein n=1 Tax=Nocardia asteroides TaxID=1824 RepID=UPI0037940171
MSGDPVEESGQAVRQGFVQALQTAHTTSALFRSQGVDGRSRAEFEQRTAHAAAKEARSKLEHYARLSGLGAEQTLTTTRIQEVQARITNAANVAEVDLRHKEAQITRADTDLARRVKDGELARAQSTELHQHRIAGYINRETREGELHGLDVEYKQLLIDIRRRAAGFTETLHRSDDPGGRGQAAAAQFAAADATRDLSPDAEADAQAYEERFAEDTGVHPGDYFTDPDRADLADGWSQGLGDVSGLAADLTADAHLRREYGIGPDDHGLDTSLGDREYLEAEVVELGEVIEAAVTVTAVNDIDTTAPDPGLTGEFVRPGPGKEVELWRGPEPDQGRDR